LSEIVEGEGFLKRAQRPKAETMEPEILLIRHKYWGFILEIISNLVGGSDPPPCCPGKKESAEDKKGWEKPT